MVSLSVYSLEREIERLDKEDYSKKNKETIKKFINDLRVKENLSEVRLITYVSRLRIVARWIPERFLDPDKKVMDHVLIELANREKDYTYNTRTAYIVAIRKFYKWYLGNNRIYPDFLEDVRKPKNHGKTEPEALITQDEMATLLSSCTNPRDRALFSMLYDSGARLGELLTMKIKDFSGDKDGVLLSVNGKTGPRRIRIIGNSIAYTRTWLDYHPQRSDPESYLFCGISKTTQGEPLNYNDLYAIFRRTLQKSGIKRRIHPHLFRHTRATILAKVVPEAPLESQMGWIHGSKQTQTYVHLSLRDQDNAILKAYGKRTREDDETVSEEQPKECPRCRTLNESSAMYCRNCWMSFDIKVALEIEEKRREVERELLTSSAIGPDVKNILEHFDEKFKDQIIEAVLSQIVNDEELKRKYLRERFDRLEENK